MFDKQFTPIIVPFTHCVIVSTQGEKVYIGPNYTPKDFFMCGVDTAKEAARLSLREAHKVLDMLRVWDLAEGHEGSEYHIRYILKMS